jgi:hypothetical protein
MTKRLAAQFIQRYGLAEAKEVNAISDTLDLIRKNTQGREEGARKPCLRCGKPRETNYHRLCAACRAARKLQNAQV